MQLKDINENLIKNTLIGSFFFYLIVRIAGSFIFENNWSFTHLLYIPYWYYLIPLSICGLFLFISKKQDSSITDILETKSKQLLFLLLLLALFVAFQYDSFLYAGGNYKINQIAQVDHIFYRFYEFGTVLIVSLFYNLISLFEIDNNTAGLISWKLFSYIGVILTFVASVLLSKEINGKNTNRFFIFILIFFGPQTLSYFGLVGYASFITASLYFFIYFGLQFNNNKSFKNLGILWFIAVASVFIHISLLLLVPALLFITFTKLTKKPKASFILGILFYLIGIVTVYIISASHFEYAKEILFINKLNIHARYNLFSLRHIGDFLQLLLLIVPQVILVKIVFLKQIKDISKSYNLQLLTLILLSSTTLVFIMEPTHSIILDIPIMAVYLSPIIVLLAIFLSSSRQSLLYSALFTLFVPLLILPSYIKIDVAENQANDYISKNQYMYIECATALQDSYFYNKDLDKANKWYVSLPKESRNYLDLTAAGEYSFSEMYSQALKLYYQLKVKVPYWGEPRYQIASIQIKQRKFQLARPEIDTCLMLDPYNKDYLKLNYAYYRDLGDFQKAKSKVLYALEIYTNDNDIKTDLAVCYYRLKDLQNADSVAVAVIKEDNTQAYAFLIRGFIAEIYNHPDQAIKYFQEFIRLAPEEPETPSIRKRLNELILKQQAG